jgi:DNA-binding transcriptional MerR regulator
MFTVTQLANMCNISRSALLYYERVGLLQAKTRTSNGYRWYGEAEKQRLEAILRFRSFGVAVTEINHLLEHNDMASQATLLKAQFNKLEASITDLRKQQSAIVALLKQPELMENTMVTKQRWVEIMQASGFSENDMIKWHQNFEKMEPDEHQKFLESLGIKSDEIVKIRKL